MTTGPLDAGLARGRHREIQNVLAIGLLLRGVRFREERGELARVFERVSVVGKTREDAVELEDPLFARVLYHLPSVLDYPRHDCRGRGRVPARDSIISVSGDGFMSVPYNFVLYKPCQTYSDLILHYSYSLQ